MGQIKKRRLRSRVFRQCRLWVPPVVISAAVITGVNFALADPAPLPSELQRYLQTAQLVTHSSVVGQHQQIYYLYKGQNVFVTSDNINHTNSQSSGRYITWLGSADDAPSQVYLYDVLTDTTLRLSGFGTNAVPDLDGNRVVWQQWDNNAWHIAYYDGLQVIQISNGYNNYRPRISGDKIAYVQYVPSDADNKPWHVIEYDTNSGQSELILKTNDGAKAAPHFTDNGHLVTNYDLNYLAS